MMRVQPFEFAGPLPRKRFTAFWPIAATSTGSVIRLPYKETDFR